MKLAYGLFALVLVCLQGCASNTDPTDEQDDDNEQTTPTDNDKDQVPAVKADPQVKPQMKPGDPGWPKKCGAYPNMTLC